MERYAGVLLPVFSLPSKYGIGCFSKSAYDFVDWLEKTGQRYWQILPLGPTSHGGSDDSPYQSPSAFGGNPYYISLEALIEEGTLTQEECDAIDFGTDPSRVDYDKMNEHRLALLRKAYERSDISHNPAYQQFVNENRWWLEDYALFMALKHFFDQQAWQQWPEDIRLRWNNALDYYREKLYFDIEFQQYMQFKFYEQWTALKTYANEKHIEIVGDIPIYVSLDSSDVWANPSMFQLDEAGLTNFIAGCPPDAFTDDGQVWGNPLYDWSRHYETGFQWWIARMRQSFKLYDVVRIDHFRGFDEYFSIPNGDTNARNGHWEKGPGMDLFNAIHNALGECNVIAEDLGTMTEGVRQLVRDSGYPNMKIMVCAFDPNDEGGANEHLPHNVPKSCVMYTGTHDNETLAGWLAATSPKQRKAICDYLNLQRPTDAKLHRALISLAMMSCADTCIIPIQDHLGLDNSARMNLPATVGCNWRWRLAPDLITDSVSNDLLAVTKRYGRANWDALNANKAEVEETEAE